MTEPDQYNPFDLPQLLQFYYKMLFPNKLFFKWLSYGHVVTDYFNRREFSFTLSGDIYIRYLSFSDADELKQQLLQKIPEKIDIGAVYNIPPKDNKKELVAFRALERELVFDIDLTDYDDVRNCCSGANICNKCWLFMIIAARILDRALRDDFGFKNILYVYSGRRGIHCWVADERARKLSFEARSAIADYLTLIEGGEFKSKKVNFDRRRNLHPSIVEAINIIDKYFSRLVDEQNMFENKKKIQKVLDLCLDKEVKSDLEKIILETKFKTSSDCWRKIEDKVKAIADRKFMCKYFIEEIKIQLCYPRLDVNVSKGVNHLLKSPFSIHPKTGKVCIPIDIKDIDSFDPFKVATINELCNEIDEYKAKSNEVENLETYEKTSLKSSIKLFKSFVNDLANDNKLHRLKESDAKLNF